MTRNIAKSAAKVLLLMENREWRMQNYDLI